MYAWLTVTSHKDKFAIMQKTYSIIIPHHNQPALLQRLLDSIPMRSDLEIVIVDDNSDTAIVDFSHFPGLDRSDVRVIFDKKGGYGGYARNLALAEGGGNWQMDTFC